jgi:hypothetical protein
MYTPISSPPSPAPASAPQRNNDDEPRGGGLGQQQAEATFERLLRSKSGARERRHDDDDESTKDESACGAAMASPLPMPAPLPLNAAAAPVACGVVEQPSATLRAAAAEAMFNAPISPLTTADNTQNWQVSLREPLGAPMELRAARAVNAAAGNVAAWSLTVSSSARDAAVYARHAPRLHERLRAREVSTHVRIERDDEDAA